ncbi:MAG: 50S ribosomal protein L11 methyltransferase [Bacteroidales bacterium]
MSYTEVNFRIEPKATGTDILIAQLSEIGYESFVENEDELLAYILTEKFQPHDIQMIGVFHSDEFKVSYTFNRIEDQNWNEVWERNFEPVVISDLVHVRAPFHEQRNDLKYEIIIEPKMSFGTAHHETTSLMISMMLEEDITGKSVLDMGCGTGILGILAEILEGGHIVAVDNDEWAFENAKENIKKE